MLALDTVTLLGIDLWKPERTLRALMKSASQATFAEVVLLTRQAIAVPSCVLLEVRTELVEDRIEYERSVLTLTPDLFRTSHVLYTEWDAWIENPEAWKPVWLTYSMIGAPWRWPLSDMPRGYPPIRANN